MFREHCCEKVKWQRMNSRHSKDYSHKIPDDGKWSNQFAENRYQNGQGTFYGSCLQKSKRFTKSKQYLNKTTAHFRLLPQNMQWQKNDLINLLKIGIKNCVNKWLLSDEVKSTSFKKLLKIKSDSTTGHQRNDRQ